MAGTFSRREKRTDADTSTSMDVNGTEALSVSTTMLPVWEDALSLLLLARLIFLPGLTPARDFARGGSRFPSRLGWVVSVAIHRFLVIVFQVFTGCTITVLDGWTVTLKELVCNAIPGSAFPPWGGTSCRPLTHCVSVT